jgi:hypothetical protein
MDNPTKEPIELPEPSPPLAPVESVSFAHRLFLFFEHPLFWGPIGIVGGLVGLFFYTPILFVCGLCILLAFLRAGVVSGLDWRKQLIAYIIVTLVAAGGLYGLQVLIKKHVPDLGKDIGETVVNRLRNEPMQRTATSSVEPTLADLYHKYEAVLGTPVQKSMYFPPEEELQIHQAWFQHGYTVLAFGEQLRFHFQLFPDGTWRQVKDIHYGDMNPKWGNLKWLRSQPQFKACQKPLIPPWGGMAATALNDVGGQDIWNFGCIESQCMVDPSKVKVQEFEHGYIFGGLRTNRNNPRGIAFVLWRTQAGANRYELENWPLSFNYGCLQHPPDN